MSASKNNIDIALINKSLFLQSKISLQSCSNVTSNILLSETWKRNSKQLSVAAVDDILNIVETVNSNVDTSNCNSWRSFLSKFEDPVTLLEKSFPQCSKCLNEENNDVELIVNNNCKCDIGVNDPSDKMFYSDHTGSVSNDNKFKAKFSRNKLFNKPVKSSSATEFNYEKSKPSVDMDVDVEDECKTHKNSVAKITFKTAKESFLASNPAARRTLGASRKAQSKFISPMLSMQDKPETCETSVLDERLKHIDPKMIELIESEIIHKGAPVGWEDIAGLQLAKSVMQEAVVWPLARPDLFTGLRRPPRGVLLFGPPGTGKTLVGKCVASQCQATFFSISASSLTSKWIGDGEKMVRALFAVARCHQPAVIFIDEIDSLLTQRSDTEHEATRRIKTEFLVQFDGASTDECERVLVIGATNRPQELDEAARRRLTKRLYIPLPDVQARGQIIKNLLKSAVHELSAAEVDEVAALTAGYSGADVRAVCAEAAMGPVRALPLDMLATVLPHQVRPVNVSDFKAALQRVRPSVSQDDLGQYVKWDRTYGQGF